MTEAALDIENALDAISFSRGVLGVVVCTMQGVPIMDTFPDPSDRAQALAYASFASEMVVGANEVVSETEKMTGKPAGDLELLRVRTTTVEIIVRTDGTHIIVILQDPDMD